MALKVSGVQLLDDTVDKHKITVALPNWLTGAAEIELCITHQNSPVGFISFTLDEERP